MQWIPDFLRFDGSEHWLKNRAVREFEGKIRVFDRGKRNDFWWLSIGNKVKKIEGPKDQI